MFSGRRIFSIVKFLYVSVMRYQHKNQTALLIAPTLSMVAMREEEEKEKD